MKAEPTTKEDKASEEAKDSLSSTSPADADETKSEDEGL